MTTVELSTEFDLRWDNLRYNASGYASLNEYEKSLYLTQAQEILFNQLYGKYDMDEFSKRALAPLVHTFLVDNAEITNTTDSLPQGKFNSLTVALPEDVAYIVVEQVILTEAFGNRAVQVFPVKTDFYNKNSNNPFKIPNKKKIWRTEFGLNYDTKATPPESLELDIPIINNKQSSLELITSYEKADIDRYFCRYLMYPTPILLEDVSAGEEIRGYATVTESVLNNIVHEQLVDLSIQIAQQALYGAQLKQ